MTEPYRNARKTRAILNRTRYAVGKRRPRHSPATPAATRMAAMLRHFQRTRLRKVEYLTRYRRAHKKTLPTETPRSPRTPLEHGPSHGPGSPSGTASGPCGPADRPACDPSCHEGSVCGAQTTASSNRRSKEACRYCRCSDRDGAPAHLSAPETARSPPEARRSPPEAKRSPTQDARSSVRKSRTRPPSMGQTARNDSSKG